MVMPTRVLMIDDHPDDISSTAAFFQREAPQIRLLVVDSVGAAKTELATHPADVVILSNHLLDSLDLVKTLQNSGRSTGYILIIELGQYQALGEAFKGGISHHVTRSEGYWECLPAMIEQAALHARLLANERSIRLTLNTLADTVDEGVAVLDQNGRLVLANRRLSELVDRDLTDRIGEPINDLFDTPNKPGTETTENVRTEAGLTLQRRSVPVFGDDQRLIGQLDVYSESEAGSRQTAGTSTNDEEIQWMRDRLLSRVSHEIKTPLTSILGFAHMMATRPDAPVDKRQKWANFIRSKSELLTRLVDDMLDLSKLQTGRFQMNQQPVELNTVIQDVVEEMAITAPHRQFDLDIPDDLPPVSIDAERINQALLNLLSNAHNFSPPETPIKIQARDEGKQIAISITDHGPAVVPDEQAYVFEPFSSEPGEGHQSGRGLGLSIAQRIIQTHNGQLWVDNYSEEGNTFKLTLPKS